MRNTKINKDKLVFNDVPPGHVVRYRHIYDLTKQESHDVGFPRLLIGTSARLENLNDGRVVARADAICNPKDTPLKALGRCIAHNRVLDKFHNPEKNVKQAYFYG
jgi:hypothetical protein